MALKRKFGGKVYYFDSTFYNKARAESRAEKIRKAGGLARIVPFQLDTVAYWQVWSREK